MHVSQLQHDVRNVTKVLYNEYLEKCLGQDELIPASGRCEDWFGIGLTLVDSLDTLLMMGLKEEYEKSREWAAKHLDFGKVQSMVSMFEIVIRALGGLNSAYQLTGDDLWKEKAVELGDLLSASFNVTGTGCPSTSVWLGRLEGEDGIDLRRGYRAARSGHVMSNPAEAGTLQLEFRTLSEITGDGKYRELVDKCEDSLVRASEKMEDSLVTDSFDVQGGMLLGRRLTVAGLVDSFYEMLVKCWVGFGKKDERYKALYEKAVEGVFKELVRVEGGYMYVGEKRRGEERSFKRQMDHLTCFFPGNLAYAALHGLGGGVFGEGERDYMTRARELTRSCYAMTRGMYHGLAGEVTKFADGNVMPAEWHDTNLLRPEIVEALYYMDAIDPKEDGEYKKWGLEMWKSIREYSQVRGKPDGMLSSTTHLLQRERSGLMHSGKLHSFAIAETLKYFFLLFDERKLTGSRLPLMEWVYNTEAHPVKIVSE